MWRWKFDTRTIDLLNFAHFARQPWRLVDALIVSTRVSETNLAFPFATGRTAEDAIPSELIVTMFDWFDIDSYSELLDILKLANYLLFCGIASSSAPS